MKTPQKVKELLKRYDESLDFIQDNISIRQRREKDSSINVVFMPERGIEFFEGMAHGLLMQVEDALLKNKCYAGFNHVGLWRNVPDGNGGMTRTRDMGGNVKEEEFADWRRVYFLKG